MGLFYGINWELIEFFWEVFHFQNSETLWPSGLRRWLKAPVRKGVGSNPTGVILKLQLLYVMSWNSLNQLLSYSMEVGQKINQEFIVVSLHWGILNEFICGVVTLPPWPNGQGVGLLIRRLRVRVPQGVHWQAQGIHVSRARQHFHYLRIHV